MRTEAKKQADKRYKAKNTVSMRLEFNKNTDADIIKFLSEQDSKLGTIKRLIREEIKKRS